MRLFEIPYRLDTFYQHEQDNVLIVHAQTAMRAMVKANRLLPDNTVLVRLPKEIINDE